MTAQNEPDSRELARFDRNVLKYASQGLSPEEIADRMPGEQSATQIAFRIKQILGARSGWLTIAEESALHLLDLQALKKKAWEMLDLEDGNRALTGLSTVMQQIGQRIDLAAQRSEETMGQIRKAQAREFAAALEMMYDGVERRLRKKYPDVEKTELREIMGSEFEHAVQRIDRLVEDAE